MTESFDRDASSKPVLRKTPDGLELVAGDLSLRADFSHMANRLRPGNLAHELVVRAAKTKGHDQPWAVDATAGLGEDSLLLAGAGFRVTLFERDPVIAALLRDALERASLSEDLADTTRRMALIEGDSVKGLAALSEHPDVVLLDPMFPAKAKSSAVKKKLQLLQMLEEPCDDEEALMNAAFNAEPRKVIVKRPAKGPYLAGRKPSYSLSGKAIRFDCYTIARA